jgi:hypothetical protein
LPPAGAALESGGIDQNEADVGPSNATPVHSTNKVESIPYRERRKTNRTRISHLQHSDRRSPDWINAQSSSALPAA